MKRTHIISILALFLVSILVWMSRNSRDQRTDDQHVDNDIAAIPAPEDGVETNEPTPPPHENVPSQSVNEIVPDERIQPTGVPASVDAAPISAEVPHPASASSSSEDHPQPGSSTDEVSQAKKQLQETRISDLPMTVSRSKAIASMKTPEERGVAGSFSGQLEPSAYNKEPWQVETNIQVTEDDTGTFTSDYTITIQSASSGRFSNSSGRGALESVRRVDKLNGLLLQLSPTMYIHALYVPASDVLVGNFYSIDDKGQTLFHGPWSPCSDQAVILIMQQEMLFGLCAS